MPDNVDLDSILQTVTNELARAKINAQQVVTPALNRFNEHIFKDIPLDQRSPESPEWMDHYKEYLERDMWIQLYAQDAAKKRKPPGLK